MNYLKALLVALVLATGLSGLAACAPTPTRQGTGEYIDDAAVTARVKVALAEDPAVSAAQVNVETYRGVVQLSGFVDADADARRAVEVARKVPGVRSVKNDLRVKPVR